MQEFDSIIVGGGIFGVFTALYLADKNYTVCLIEKEQELFSKASIVNQSRLHSGYHYPRSIRTAQMAYEYRDRFAEDHKKFIHSNYESYYAIDKSASSITSEQFEQFCDQIRIPAHRVTHHPLFNLDRMEALYRTEEYSFDPMLIAAYYIEKIKATKNISVLLHSNIRHAEKFSNHWKVTYTQAASPSGIIKASSVINATYAGTNGINRIFGLHDLDLMYEISEIAFVHAPLLQNTGLTVVDGPFASFMPYGLSGQISLSSVIHTHHQVSYDALPTFDCQKLNTNCTPDGIANCNRCGAAPASHQSKMIDQIKEYLQENISIQYLKSLFAIKTKLKSNQLDDGRPTEISKLSDQPAYFCLFSGKINSIYEIEKLLANEF